MITKAVTAQSCSLFEIDAELEEAFDQLQEERDMTGMISDESRERCTQLFVEFGKKIDRIAAYLRIQQRKANIAAEEAQRLQQRRRSAEQRVSDVKEMLTYFMHGRGLKRLEGELNTIRRQTNSQPSLQVNDWDLPQEFCLHTGTIPNRLLKEMLEQSENLPNPVIERSTLMRNAGRLKLGYYPLPVEEARNLRNLLIAPQPFFAVDPCAGDGTALVEITRELPAQNAAIELDTDRAAAAATRGLTTTHGSTFESHMPAGSCSLLFLNPPYDVEMGRHSNQRLELLFLDHCYGWLKAAGVLIFAIPEVALSHCAKRLTSQFERISVFRLSHPESVRFKQLAVLGIRKAEHKRGDTRAVDQLLRLAYATERLPILGAEATERYPVPPSAAVAVQYRGLPLDEIEDGLVRSSAMQSALNLLIRKPESIAGRPVTPLHGGHVGLLCTAGMLNGVFGEGRERHVAHWRSVKHVDVYNEEEDGYQIVRRRERFSHELTLAYQTGRVVVLKEAEEEGKKYEKCA